MPAADTRRADLRALIAKTGTAFGPLGIKPSGTHIQPLPIGADGRAMAVAGALQTRGFDVRGIRPPTVPDGTARLRVSITLNTDETAIADLASALGDLL